MTENPCPAVSPASGKPCAYEAGHDRIQTWDPADGSVTDHASTRGPRAGVTTTFWNDRSQAEDAVTAPLPEAVGTQALKGNDDSRPVIPSTVTHDEFLAAIQPLCDLLNVSPYEIYRDIHISSPSKAEDGTLLRISFNVTAPEATIPPTTRYGEWAEVSVHCSVDVI